MNPKDWRKKDFRISVILLCVLSLLLNISMVFAASQSETIHTKVPWTCPSTYAGNNVDYCVARTICSYKTWASTSSSNKAEIYAVLEDHATGGSLGKEYCSNQYVTKL